MYSGRLAGLVVRDSLTSAARTERERRGRGDNFGDFDDLLRAACWSEVLNVLGQRLKHYCTMGSEVSR